MPNIWREMASESGTTTINELGTHSENCPGAWTEDTSHAIDEGRSNSMVSEKKPSASQGERTRTPQIVPRVTRAMTLSWTKTVLFPLVCSDSRHRARHRWTSQLSRGRRTRFRMVTVTRLCPRLSVRGARKSWLPAPLFTRISALMRLVRMRSCLRLITWVVIPHRSTLCPLRCSLFVLKITRASGQLLLMVTFRRAAMTRLVRWRLRMSAFTRRFT